jgi:NAD(P)-dependent dehydrogenase (short-subunit alcohol dehydrogenase family)
MKKIAIVTGSNTGIGKQTAKRLAENGFMTIMACRSMDKGKQALEEIIRESEKGDIGNSLIVMELKLDDLTSVKAFSDNFKAKYKHLNVLVNNAGIFPQSFETTVQGFEQSFGVNYLAHFYLTLNLLDVMKDSNESRIINLASNAQQ